MIMADLLHPITTQHGHKLQVRFLTSDDGDLLLDLFRHLSPDSRYQRFHIVADHVSEQTLKGELPMYLDVDQRNHVALIAVVDQDGEEIPIAVARFRRDVDSDKAEAAIVVQDDWQRQGIGSALLEQLVSVGRAAGVRSFYAWIQGSNRAALRLSKGRDLPVQHHQERGEYYVIVQLDGEQEEDQLN
jgi:acetyltransferase